MGGGGSRYWSLAPKDQRTLSCPLSHKILTARELAPTASQSFPQGSQRPTFPAVVEKIFLINDESHCADVFMTFIWQLMTENQNDCCCSKLLILETPLFSTTRHKIAGSHKSLLMHQVQTQESHLSSTQSWFPKLLFPHWPLQKRTWWPLPSFLLADSTKKSSYDGFKQSWTIFSHLRLQEQ